MSADVCNINQTWLIHNCIGLQSACQY